jgi:hypothetical protein
MIRVNALARIFNSLDPTPFRERDLDHDAERFIVEWAQEAPPGAPISITVQLPASEHHPEAAATLADAVRNNFDDRKVASRGGSCVSCCERDGVRCSSACRY